MASNEINGELSSCPCKRSKADSNKVTVVLGAQWGDEGKGKVVDLLAVDSDIVCRCQVSCFCSNTYILSMQCNPDFLAHNEEVREVILDTNLKINKLSSTATRTGHPVLYNSINTISRKASYLFTLAFRQALFENIFVGFV